MIVLVAVINDRLKKDWKAAYEICRDLARDCAELHIWEPASRFALAGALKSHERLHLEKSEDWTNIALAYLRICAILRDDDDNEEMESVVKGLREGSRRHYGLFDV